MGNESNTKTYGLLDRMQNKLSEIESVAKIGTWEYQIDTREVFWSDQMFKIFDRASHLGHPRLNDVHESIHHSDRFQWELLINKVTIDGQPIDVVIRVVNGNADMKWVRKIARGVFEENKLVSIRGFCQDITELKRLETHYELTKHLVED
jgi:PAS domain-containing protein